MNDVALPDWKIRDNQRQDRERLGWHLEQMNKGTTMITKSLKEIHDQKLYRHDFESFDDFCTKKLGMTRARAYQIIAAQNVREALVIEGGEEMSSTVDALSDRVAGALNEVPKEVRLEVVKQAVAQGKVTEKAVRAIAGTERAKKKCPHCGETL